MKLKSLLAVVVGVTFAVCASADTWYADASKTAGTGDGKSPETAFHTIQEAVEAASAGDTISVAEGTYAEGWQPTREHSYRSLKAYHNCRVYLKKNLNLIASGRKSETVILGEIGTEDASMRRDPTDTDKIGFATNNVSCIVVGAGAEGSLIKGFTLRDGWACHMAHGGDAAGGVCHYSPSSKNDFTVIDCDFDHCFGRGAGGVIGGTVIRCRFDRCRVNDARGIVSTARAYNCLVTRTEIGYDFYNALAVNCTAVGNVERHAFQIVDDCPEGMGIAYNTAGYWGATRPAHTGTLVNCVVDSTGWNTETSSAVTQITSAELDRLDLCYNPTLGDYRPVDGGLLFSATQKSDKQWMELDFIPEDERSLDFNGNPIDSDADLPIGVLLPPKKAESGILRIDPGNAFVIDGFTTSVSTAYVYYRQEKWPQQVTVKLPDPNERFLGTGSPFTIYAGLRDTVTFLMPPKYMTDGTTPYGVQTLSALRFHRELYVDDDKSFDGDPDGSADKPYKSIQAAVDALAKETWTVIHVAEGTYEYDEVCGKTDPTGLKAVVYVPSDKYAVIKADGRREKTIIKGAADPSETAKDGCGDNAIRCAYLGTHCCLAGFVLQDGHTAANDSDLYQGKHLGGGVTTASSTIAVQVQDCIFTGCAGTTAAVNNGNYFRCIFTNNLVYSRGIIHSAALSGCLIARNGTSSNGGSYVTVYGGSTLVNTTVYEPTGSGVKFYNTNNSVVNSVVVGKGSLPDADSSHRVVGCVVRSTVSGGDALTEGPNEHRDPALARITRGDYRPRSDSPCVGGGQARDAGTGTKTLDVDVFFKYIGLSLDGQRLVRPDGSVSVGAFAEVASLPTGAGVYVAPTGDDAALGIDDTTPLKTLQAAMDLAVAEGETNVFALAGTYADGESAAHTPRVFQGSDPKVGARVHVPAGVTLRAVDPDPSRTVIVGRSSTVEMPDDPFSSADLGHGFGDDALRCVFLENGAKVVGFTLTGGRTSYMKDGSHKYIDDTLGGGVLGRSVAACSVEDCILTGNRSPNGAGGSFVTFHRCVVTNNLVSNSYGSFTRHGAAYDCFVAGNYGQWPCDVISKGSEIVNCTFCDNWETTNRLYRARGVFNAESAVVRNCILCGVDAANVLRAVGEVSNCLVPSAVTAFDGVTNNVNNTLTDSQIVALIDADGHPRAADANIVDAGVGRSVLEFDLAGTARVKNGTVDIGAFEYDWKGDYSKALAKKNLTVTDVSASGVVETADRKVTLTDGGALTATLAGEVGMDYILSATVTGSGALTVTQNGAVVGQITAATRSLSFSGVSASDRLEFAYSGEGSATFDPLKRNIGMLLLVR